MSARGGRKTPDFGGPGRGQKRAIFGGLPDPPKNPDFGGFFGARKSGPGRDPGGKNPGFFGPGKKRPRKVALQVSQNLSRLGELLNTLENVTPGGPGNPRFWGSRETPEKGPKMALFWGLREPPKSGFPGSPMVVAAAARARHPGYNFHVASVASQATLGTQRSCQRR